MSSINAIGSGFKSFVYNPKILQSKNVGIKSRTHDHQVPTRNSYRRAPATLSAERLTCIIFITYLKFGGPVIGPNLGALSDGFVGLCPGPTLTPTKKGVFFFDQEQEKVHGSSFFPLQSFNRRRCRSRKIYHRYLVAHAFENFKKACRNGKKKKGNTLPCQQIPNNATVENIFDNQK